MKVNFLVFKCRLIIKKCKIDLRIGWFIILIISGMRCFLILCVLIFVSCNSGEKKEKDSIVEKKDSLIDVRPKYGTPEFVLEYDGEKVVLISKVVKLDPIKVSKIIADYDKNIGLFKSYLKVNEIIRQLANENSVSESVISTIIFMFKYDTLIKEDYEGEIIDEYTDDANHNAIDDYEVNTGR
jgi:hypothetical protein